MHQKSYAKTEPKKKFKLLFFSACYKIRGCLIKGQSNSMTDSSVKLCKYSINLAASKIKFVTTYQRSWVLCPVSRFVKVKTKKELIPATISILCS